MGVHTEDNKLAITTEPKIFHIDLPEALNLKHKIINHKIIKSFKS